MRNKQSLQKSTAHDLYDGLCQQLTGVALIAKALTRRLAANERAESVEAGEIVDLINRALDQTRDLARGLGGPLREKNEKNEIVRQS